MITLYRSPKETKHMRKVDNKYKALPFWSWNDDLDPKECVRQVEWMHEKGIGGFFMHARGGLTTPYLGEKWFECVDASSIRAKELGMHAYAYDENGWPSGFVGGELLKDIENHDRYLDFAYGKYDENSYVSYDYHGDKLVRVTSGDDVLNVYWRYASSTADILNPDVVQQFIDKTHEQYKKRDTYDLKGFFTDEPQYFRWGTPFTKMIIKYFEEEYHEDIRDGVGLLFIEKEGYRKFRYQYWKGMQALMLKNFAERVYNWCEDNGYKLTGHYVEESDLGHQILCNGGIMPYYEFEHIPGIDKLGRPVDHEVPSKQLGSVAEQVGRKQRLCEMFACDGWDVSPLELKKIAESEYVGGVNLMCHHLLPYSEHGQRKRDYPAHFSAVNPWIEKNFKEFNDYFSVLGEILANSKERPNVALFQPIRSAYFDYKRYLPGPDSSFCIGDFNKSYLGVAKELMQRQIPHHYLDETILARHGHVEGDKLVVGNCSYHYIVFPKTLTMDSNTEKLLKEFVSNGGKVLLVEGKPSYVEWREYDYPYLTSNATWEEIEADRPFVAERNESVRLAHRIDDSGNEFIYAVALNGETTLKIQPKGYKSFKSYDILKDEYKIIDTTLHFEDGQSYLLYFSNEEPVKEGELSPLHLNKGFEVTKPVENFLTLDYISLSTDGVNYGEKLHHMGVFNLLLQKRYEGEIYFKYTFTANKVPSICSALIENMNIKEVKINGKTLTKHTPYLEKELWEYDIASEIKEGVNEIVVLVNWHQDDIVYYALFDETATESIKNCLAYNSDAEAIFLKGNFGVSGDFKPGRVSDVLLGENFALEDQKTFVNELITDGYPFFAGNINLKQVINVTDTNRYLEIPERFHLVDVKINGVDCGRMMFDHKLDISKALKVGDNVIELELTVGRRNMMGPFHTPEQENLFVGPFTFERIGTWDENGHSSILREPYAFVKTII